MLYKLGQSSFPTGHKDHKLPSWAGFQNILLIELYKIWAHVSVPIQKITPRRKIDSDRENE